MNDSNVLDKQIVLVLNNLWMPVHVATPKSIIGKLCVNERGSRLMHAFDISYPQNVDGTYNTDTLPDYIQAVDWEDWIKLPVRSCDFSIKSAKMEIRVPTVVVTTEFDDMPESEMALNLKNLYDLYGGTCAYSKKKLDRKRASIDHVVPRSKGGEHTWFNVRLAEVEINNKKGNRSNKEAGLPEVPPIMPRKLKAFEKIRPRYDIPGWSHFLIKK